MVIFRGWTVELGSERAKGRRGMATRGAGCDGRPKTRGFGEIMAVWLGVR